MHTAASRKCDFIYSPASPAGLAWYLANCQLFLPYLLFSYPCSHEFGFGSREVLDVTMIREYLMGMVICIPFSLDSLLIFCPSKAMPSLNLHASLWLLCTVRDELPQKVSLISVPEHERERDLRKDYQQRTLRKKAWNRMRRLVVRFYSQQSLPFHNFGVNNFLHLPPCAADMFDHWKQ